MSEPGEVSRPAVSERPEPPHHADGEWHRLHPLTPLARGWTVVAAVLFVLTQNVSGTAAGWTATGVLLAGAVVVGLIYGLFSWWFTRYRIEEDALRLDTGVIFRRSRRVRLDRLQAVDVVRPLIARLLGLAELRLEVAGGSSSEAPLAYLSERNAQVLRATLLARAAGVRPDAPEADEQVLVRVPPDALIRSQLLSGSAIFGILLVIALISGAIGLHTPFIFIGAVPTLIALATSEFRAFSTHFDFVVAESADGLRLRHGLLEHRSQTVPPGRVQALRIVQPLLWRRWDWVKVEVNVAGYAPGGGEDGTSRTSVLLPVAPRATALGVVGRVLPGVDIDAVALVGLPVRARWVRPIGWRFAACGADERVFVSKRGRLRRELDVIAHGKVQSLRLSSGPIRRRLGLATVHLDSTPGPVKVHAPDRDAVEARRIVEAQAERDRTARRAAGPERWMTAHVQPAHIHTGPAQPAPDQVDQPPPSEPPPGPPAPSPPTPGPSAPSPPTPGPSAPVQPGPGEPAPAGAERTGFDHAD
ncbi:MAG TPA: PH domain-containing protein [Actinomycetes bacterium]|nr:PH domain-containing protein [Actinomycetes bacterium]